MYVWRLLVAKGGGVRVFIVATKKGEYLMGVVHAAVYLHPVAFCAPRPPLSIVLLVFDATPA